MTIILTAHLFRWRQKVVARKVQEAHNTPADYAILVERIPKHLAKSEKLLKEDVKEFFETRALNRKKFPDVKVKKVMFLYRYSEYYKLVDKRDSLMKKKQKLLVDKYYLD